MTEQEIRNARTILVGTKYGAVKIAKKEARKYIARCKEHGHDLHVDITEIYEGKTLVILD